MIETKPWYKSKTLWWIAISTIAASAQPIGTALDNRTLKFGDLGGLVAIVASNGMAAYSRMQSTDKLGAASGNQE